LSRECGTAKFPLLSGTPTMLNPSQKILCRMVVFGAFYGMEINPLAVAYDVEKLENGKWVHTGQFGDGRDEGKPLPKEVTERIARGEEGEVDAAGETYRIRRAAKP
jgi:hypothetical protein